MSGGGTDKLLYADYDAVRKAIQATHGNGIDKFNFNIRPLLPVIEDILSLTAHRRQDIKDIRNTRNGFFNEISYGDPILKDKLVLKINTISWEILRNYSGGENMHEIILDIFNALSPFLWPGKAVLTLAAFAVNYGEFWLVEQLHSTNPVAHSIAFLEQFPTEMERNLIFSDMNQVIKAILRMVNCICESIDLQPLQYLQNERVLLDMIAQIPEYTYWIVRSIVICQAQLSKALNADRSRKTSSIEASNVSNLINQVTQLGETMRKQLDSCYQRAEEKRIEAFMEQLRKIIEKPSYKENVTILKKLVSDPETEPLYDGHNKKTITIDTLEKKTVLLYLSELKHLPLEVATLSEMYLESGNKPTRYDVVWLPVADYSSSTKPEKIQMFKDIQSTMPWLSCRELSLVDPAVAKFIRDEWQFKRRSMIKVLDQQGRLLEICDAMHMIMIWGGLAEPFSAKKEEELWANEYWSVDLLLQRIVPSATQWVAEGKYLCLYGGDNIDWITKFTTTILAISKEAQIPLMMLYMGTDNTNRNIKKRNAVTSMGNLGDINLDPLTIGRFWARLESIWHSRVQIGMLPESDELIKEVFKMRSFDCSGRGWAIISKGSKEMAEGMGDIILKALSEYDQWKGNVEGKGFVSAVRDYMSSIGTSTLCNTLLVPKCSGIPKNMDCFECRREMKLSTRFACCGD